MPDPIHNPKCHAAHMGLWMVERRFMMQAVAAIKGGLWKLEQTTKAPRMVAGEAVVDGSGDLLYAVTPEGIAVIQIQGVMAKAAGKYASASTVQVRMALRAAALDQAVGGIMTIWDTPGGSVSGTQALADDMRAADAAKPVHAYAEDMTASAGYWSASQARRLSANRSAIVGSLGTYMVVEDTSKKAEMDGVQVHVISTGPQKGAFVDGAPVTDDQLAEARVMVEDLNALFIQGVAGGRRMSMEQAAALFDGKVHIAEKAKGLGLIDAVQSLDAAMAELVAVVAAKPKPSPDNARRMRLAKARR
jgi:signal peptide peptidase SppA